MTPKLELALNAAFASGIKIMEIYSSKIYDINHKSDGSPITQADLISNKIIVSYLEKTGIPILSEEAVVDYSVRKYWKSFWIIDPLDGTKDFIKRNDEFTVNIALIENGRPTLGVVHAPGLDKTWYAASGYGAWALRKGKKSKITALKNWPRNTRMFLSCFHDVPSSGDFKVLNGVTNCIRAGAASKLARLAESDAEFYPRFAGTSEWDIASGVAILEEAGGKVLSINGEELIFNKPLLRNPFFIAWRPPLTWAEIKIPVNL